MKTLYDFIRLERSIATIDVDGVQIGKFMQVFMYCNNECCENSFNTTYFGGTLYWERRKIAEKRGHMVWVERKSNRVRFK